MSQKQNLNPVQKFINAESFSGILLFFVTLLALVLSNSPLKNSFDSIWQYEIGIQSEGFSLVKPLILWINDGLMAIFFFLIGLEIKRELLLGELNSVKKASLPVIAAVGGMLIPVLFYIVLNNNSETANGWGIPMATDIAFTLAVLKILGKRVPLSLKIFLTAFAIIDDIGAVMIIAFFYSGNISWNLLLIAIILLSVLYILSYLKIHSKFLLLIFGIIIWVLFLKSGIHPTIAGILLAFAVPIRQKVDEFTFADKLQEITARLTLDVNTNKLPLLTARQIEEIDNLEDCTEKVQSPLQKLEKGLHNWVAYLIMPVFALSNSGVNLVDGADYDLSLATTIALSLFLGKAIGVTLFSFLAIQLNVAALPENTSFTQLIGIAVLSGVGFTMSLFIGGLAFPESIIYLSSAKIGIIAGSLISGLIGYLILRFGRSGHGSARK